MSQTNKSRKIKLLWSWSTFLVSTATVLTVASSQLEAEPLGRSPEGPGGDSRGATPCDPVDCYGQPLPRKLDVNKDCRVSLADAHELIDYLNRSGGTTPVNDSNAHMDLHEDSLINDSDVNRVMIALTAAGCVETTPTATSAPTASATLTPIPTPLATVLPPSAPTVAPTPRGCEITLLSFSRPEWWNSDSQGWSLANLRKNWDQLPPGFQCLDTMVNKAIADTQARMGRNFWGWYGDDGIFFSLLNPIFGPLTWERGQNDDWSYWVPEWERNYHTPRTNAFCGMKSVIHSVGRAGNHSMQCVAGHFFLDKDCNRIPIGLDGAPLDPNLKVCGNPALVFGKSSPVSLVWREGADSTVDVRFVKFPLIPTLERQLFTWKASEALPLVVYDPNHTGVITQASQLFGNWTFGGKRIASLSVDSMGAAEPWRDGYEALASLDLDNDGSVRGEELRDLGLWFDRNQNGISEPGEVEKLTLTGVTALFFQADSYNDSTKTLRASVGFERTIDGRVVRGPSIDWFGGSSPSAASLVRGLLGSESSQPRMRAEHPQSTNNTELAATARSGSNPESVALEDRAWGGAWAWKLKGEEHKPLPDGYLMMGFKDAKRLAGVSVNPTFLQPRGGDISTMVSIHHFEGELRGTGATQEFSFTLTHESQKIHSTVKRSAANPELLEGVSRVVIPRKGGTETATYEWTASRK